jgi:hypothetical protein
MDFQGSPFLRNEMKKGPASAGPFLLPADRPGQAPIQNWK